jgi:general secretion pathway protein K
MKASRRDRGFTLVEVLIALAITAFVSTIAYTSLSTVITGMERTRENSQRAYAVNRAWMIISRDLRQFVSRPVRDEFGEQEPALQGGPAARYTLSLTRSGWHNPNAHPRSNLQRVNYRLEDDAEGVEQLRLEFLGSMNQARGTASSLDTRQWSESWIADSSQPDTVLPPPAALQLTLQLEDWGELRLPCRQKGAALVVAMLVFALCTALIVAMKGDFTRLYQRSANTFLAEQAYAYLRGAEELATIALLVDYDLDGEQETPRDDLGEVWAQPATPYALDEGGWLQGSLQDLQGRFNLNALTGGAEGERRFTPAQVQFIRLLQALEDPRVSEQEARMITASVADWLDRDETPGPDGVEDDYYFSRNPAHRTANRPMASVSELRAVAYITPEIYAALRPYITVWPQSPSTLNIHTAPALVLRSINGDKDFSPLSDSDAESLVSYREDTAGRSGSCRQEHALVQCAAATGQAGRRAGEGQRKPVDSDRPIGGVKRSCRPVQSSGWCRAGWPGIRRASRSPSGWIPRSRLSG